MSIRTERVASVLREDLGKILLNYQRNNIITITKINMTPDLSIARVNISIMDPSGNEGIVFENLREKTSQIRMELAQLIRHQVRKIPELQFFMDETAEHAQRMEQLFRKARSIESDQDDSQADA